MATEGINVYLFASKIRILLYTKFFSNSIYQDQLVSSLSDKLHTEVCIDGNCIIIDKDTTENINLVVQDVLIDFIDDNRSDILELFREELSECNDETVFNELHGNIYWLYEVLYTKNTAVILLY